MKTIKKQTRKVGVAGGFVNQIMGNNSTEPVVGEGATMLSYSDRNPYEVISVSEDGNECEIREYDCNATHNGMTESQQWEFISRPEWPTTTLKWHPKKGWCVYEEQIQIIKSLVDKLIKEHDFHWSEHLPNGTKYVDLVVGGEDGLRGVNTEFKLVKGITKVYKKFRPVSIIFGFAEKYYDYSF